MKHWFIGSFALLSAFGAAQQFYENDFESGSVGSEWTVAGESSTPVIGSTPTGGRKFLGEFGNDTLTLSLSGLSAGTTYTVAFDLFVIKSWDGNANGVGPDQFEFFAGSSSLLSTTFSNTEETGSMQSYPSAYLAGNFAPMTGADEINTLGYTFYGDSVYKFGGATNPLFSFVASGSNMSLMWRGSNLQGIGDESWGIDNVDIDAVPEPATMVVLAAAAFAGLRRKRK